MAQQVFEYREQRISVVVSAERGKWKWQFRINDEPPVIHNAVSVREEAQAMAEATAAAKSVVDLRAVPR